MDAQTLLTAVLALAPGLGSREKCDRPTVTVAPEGLIALLGALRDDERFFFDVLFDHTAVDWVKDNRFELIYQLYSLKHGHYLSVSCSVPRDNPVVPTAMKLWRIAEWQEREVYDLFGVLYDGHSDLRRLLLEDEWQGHPLRKDYSDPNMLERTP
jgi:NADH-quinone oxidoreductase subunit C